MNILTKKILIYSLKSKTNYELETKPQGNITREYHKKENSAIVIKN